MVAHREHLSLSMKVSQRGPLMAASGDPKSGVLDDLELVAGGFFGGRVPDRGSIHEERPYKCSIGEHYGLLLLTPVCTCESFDDFEAVCCFGGYCLDVVTEGEVGVESHSKYFGGAIEGEWGVSEGDGRVNMGLVGVGGEKGDM